MTDEQKHRAAIIATQMILAGADPKGLVHIIYYPFTHPDTDEDIMGISTPLQPDFDISGHACKYYSLHDLANNK